MAHKRKKQHTQKKLDLSKAERNVVVLDIPEKDRHCPACGSNELVHGYLNTSHPGPVHVPANSFTDSMVIFTRMTMQDTAK